MADSTSQRPIRAYTLYGEPITAYGRTLTPVARVIAGGNHVGSIGEKSLSGHGRAIQLIRPIQMIEEQNGEKRTLPIPDVTREAVLKMTVIGVVVMLASLLTMLIVRVNRNS